MPATYETGWVRSRRTSRVRGEEGGQGMGLAYTVSEATFSSQSGHVSLKSDDDQSSFDEQVMVDRAVLEGPMAADHSSAVRIRVAGSRGAGCTTEDGLWTCGSLEDAVSEQQLLDGGRLERRDVRKREERVFGDRGVALAVADNDFD